MLMGLSDARDLSNYEKKKSSEYNIFEKIQKEVLMPYEVNALQSQSGQLSDLTFLQRMLTFW